MDNISAKERSRVMSLVRSRGTKPEMRVRRLLYRLGFRYRLHRRELPGSPDIVFVSRRKAMFVHGCFWHRHEGCALARMPKSRVDFWAAKFETNQLRDAHALNDIRNLGWDALVVWECELKDEEALARRLRGFLGEES
jgi:DNA mismatch endonuclease (patch repair protein)